MKRKIPISRTLARQIGGGIGIAILAFLLGLLAGGGEEGDHADHKKMEERAAEQAAIWSCAMHPQIQVAEAGKCPRCGMNLTLVDQEPGDDEPWTLVMSPAAKKLAEIVTTPVERKFVTAKIRMVGKVDYDETRVKTISAWVSGRIDRLYVDYTGIQVRKGDHLVSLYSPVLFTAQEELLAAKRQVDQPAPEQSEFLRKSNQRALESVREKLRLWGLDEKQIQQIEKRGTAQDHVQINAPAAGIVILKGVREGDYVKTGTKLFVIADLSRLWVKLDAYESDLPWIRYGQQVEIETEAYPGDIFQGWITFISPVLDAQTRTVKVRVNVENPVGKLKPEMFVRAIVRSKIAKGGRVMDERLAGKWICPMHPEIVKDKPGKCDICGMPLVRAEDLGFVALHDEQAKPLVVPVSAVLKTGKRAVVYVKKPHAARPTYEGREIVLGPRAGDHYIVLSGLQEGEHVVLNGAFKIDSALQIQAKRSMMNPEGGRPTPKHDQGHGDQGHGQHGQKGIGQ